MSHDLTRVKTQIIEALGHPEAGDGLFFRNFQMLHEEDERSAVEGEQVVVLDALRQLIDEGRVRVEEGHKELIFHLVAE